MIVEFLLVLGLDRTLIACQADIQLAMALAQLPVLDKTVGNAGTPAASAGLCAVVESILLAETEAHQDSFPWEKAAEVARGPGSLVVEEEEPFPHPLLEGDKSLEGRSVRVVVVDTAELMEAASRTHRGMENVFLNGCASGSKTDTVGHVLDDGCAILNRIFCYRHLRDYSSDFFCSLDLGSDFDCGSVVQELLFPSSFADKMRATIRSRFPRR